MLRSVSEEAGALTSLALRAAAQDLCTVRISSRLRIVTLVLLWPSLRLGQSNNRRAPEELLLGEDPNGIPRVDVVHGPACDYEALLQFFGGHNGHSTCPLP